jgi:hypothetical protein
MIEPVQIDPDAVYDNHSLYWQLGLSPTSLSKARRERRLRHTRQGARILYLGEWVLDWLRREGEQQEVINAS